jgi:hypothetical protein
MGAAIQFVVLPANRVMTSSLPSATIMDQVPFVNLVPSGVCMSLSNPAVASATTAAAGVLTPQPCTPVPAGPWSPGSTRVMFNKKPALNNTCQLMCSYGGMIAVTNPGQMRVQCT